MATNFHPTQWTLVLQARGDDEQAKIALSELCAAYYEPVLAFLQREGRDKDAAREMSHGFFESLLEGGIGSPDPQRGRFRSYLLGALKHFLTKQRDAALAKKRGGGLEHVTLLDEHPNALGAPDDTLAFDRDWAMTLIARSLATLESEHVRKIGYFTTLQPWLNGGAECSQAEAARTLDMSETAVKVAIHRLRVRFRELIRAEVAATLDDPDEVAEELRHLIMVASKG